MTPLSTKQKQNKLMIRRLTDSTPFRNDPDFGNERSPNFLKSMSCWIGVIAESVSLSICGY